MAKNQLISIDASQLKYVEQVLRNVKNGAARVVQGAINTSLTEARRNLYDAIKNEYSLNKISSRHKEAISMQRASPSNLAGTLRYRGFNIPLINFRVSPKKPAKRNPRQVRVRSEIHRGEVKTWRGAFIAQMKSGHVGVFTRVGRSRYPIKEQYSTSVPQMINYVLEHDPSLQSKLQGVAEKKLNEQVEKLLAKVGK